MSNISMNTQATVSQGYGVGTFDYVAFDEQRTEKIKRIKAKFEEIEALCIEELIPGRHRSLVGTKLEEAYMWCGKAIRDEQVATNNAPNIDSRTEV